MSSKIELELLAATEKAIADLRKAQSQIEGVGDSTKKPKKLFGEFADSVSGALLGINQGLALANKAGQAMKAAFDFAQEGAQIEFTATKFDRLAKSVNTTSDALLGDMTEATGGLRSQLELTAMGTDFLTLGLAKSHDEVVRLTNVAGQLDMNMNQLVLTLTNQTTMRFDALGVAVDGFDEKVAALEETGMSASDAFNEAFLQQAEEQIEKVGSVSDSSAASFMKFTAATEDLVAEWKKGASEGGKLLGVLTDFARASANGLVAQDGLNEALQKGIITDKEYEEAMTLMRHATDGAAMAQDILNQKLNQHEAAAGRYSAQVQGNAIATYEFSDAIDELAQGEMDHFLKKAQQGAEISQAFASAQANSAVETANMTQALSNMSTKQAALTLMDDLLQATEDFPDQAGTYMDAWEEIGRKYGEVNDKGIALEAGKKMIVEGLATGEITDAVTAWDGLKTAIDKGQTSTEEIGAAIGLLPSSAITSEAGVRPPMEEMTDVFRLTKEEVNQIKEGLDSIPGTYRASVVVSYSGGAGYSPPANNTGVTGVTGGGRLIEAKPEALGGPVFAGQPYWVGEEGPEPFVPAQDGRILSKQDAQAAIGDNGMNAALLTSINDGIQSLRNNLADDLVAALNRVG